MNERVFVSNNQDGMIENYRMMHFLNVTDVLTNRVNCSGSTFDLTLFWRVLRDLRTLLPNEVGEKLSDWAYCHQCRLRVWPLATPTLWPHTVHCFCWLCTCTARGQTIALCWSTGIHWPVCLRVRRAPFWWVRHSSSILYDQRVLHHRQRCDASFHWLSR